MIENSNTMFVFAELTMKSKVFFSNQAPTHPIAPSSIEIVARKTYS